MKYNVTYKDRKAIFYAPQSDEILKHWKRGHFYEAQPGQLLDLVSSLDIGCYVDIGAHWGNHAAFMAHQAKELYLFELRPDSFEVLKQNTRLWANKCSYHNLAIGDYSGSVSYEQEHANNVGSTKVIEGFGSVLMVPLDTLNLSPSFIKIDVEGYEVQVLKGAAKTIKEHRPILAIEVAENEAAINAMMREMGYKGQITKNATKTALFKPIQ